MKIKDIDGETMARYHEIMRRNYEMKAAQLLALMACGISRQKLRSGD